ncbi:glycosyl hydrolase 3 family protein [Abortiporus biennis]
MAEEFNVKEILSKLTIGEKIKLLTGLGWWHTEPIPRLNVPSVRMSDGPNGVRGTRFFNGVPSSCFPSSTGLGSSFDVELAQQVGEALGFECRAKSTHVLLAPTVNTQRSPLGGRGFESFSEDPVLNGEIAAAYINGVQSTGVSATIKHFVANDQEYQRFSSSSEVCERALREIYLVPFEIALKKSNPWALMSSYNRINGLHVSESHRLLTELLRGEWGYKGTIMSDWTGVYSTTEAIKAGLDLEMPGPTVVRGAAITRALQAEKLFPEDIDIRAEKVLEMVQKAQASGIPFNGPENARDTPEASGKTIAVIGPNAKHAMISGGGSASLQPTYVVSPLEGIKEAAKGAGAIDVKYSLGAMTLRFLPLLDAYISLSGKENGALLEFWNEAPTRDFIALDADLTANIASPIWSTKTDTSNVVLMDGVDDIVNDVCYQRYITHFKPDQDGDWELSLTIAGRGNLFFDKKLVIDLSTNPKPGKFSMELGTEEKRTVVKGLEAGKSYPLEVRIHNEDFIVRMPPFKCHGGLRIGAEHYSTPEKTLNDAVALAKEVDLAILVVGLNMDWESEGYDRDDMKLPGLSDTLVSSVLAANPNTIVVNQSGTPVEMPWVDQAHTLIQAFYGGNEVGNGLSDVLFGQVNPSSKLPLTFPKRLEDSPSFTSYSFKNQEYGKVLYNEGVFVGYRGFEQSKVSPLFPFGYGLSFTTFEYSTLAITGENGEFSVKFRVKNTGTLAGREIVQVYVSDLEASLPRPPKELKGFIKLFLEPGEEKEGEVILHERDFAYFNERRGGWVIEGGEFNVLVAASSADIKLKGTVTLHSKLL